MSTRRIWIDLTPYVRNPHSGVGLSAWRCYQALLTVAPGTNIEGVSRIASKTLRRYTWIGRLLGPRSTLFHSFEHRLPPVLRSRRVLTVHDAWTLRKNPYQSPEFQRASRPVLLSALRRADKIISPSHAVREELIREFSVEPERIQTVYWGPLFSRTVSAIPDPAVAAILDRKRPFILCVGYLETRKNQNVLFEAWPRLKDVDLVVVGNVGFGGEKILAHLQSLPQSETARWFYLRSIPETSLATLFRSAAVFVQPSLEEGFGLPVLDAMAAHRPVILNRTPTLVELGEDSALYFDANQGSDELTDLLHDLLSNPESQAQWGARAEQRSRAFSWRTTAEDLLQIYASIP